MSFQDGILIGLIIGIFSYSMFNIGKGCQKYGIEGLKESKTAKNSGIWILGLILTTAHMFIQWIALLFAPINIIAPLEAFGLIILVIFSYQVLKEKISKIEIFGIFLIIIGTILITLVNPNTSEIELFDFYLLNFVLFSLIIAIFEFIYFLVIRLKDKNNTGFILSIMAGTCMAFQTVSKRITVISEEFISMIFIFITFLMATLTFLFTQLAFTKAKANIAVPCSTSASIILAILAGFLVLNEIISLIQIVGIILLIGGIIFLTAFKKENVEKA